jgi:hypothetical protein
MPKKKVPSTAPSKAVNQALTNPEADGKIQAPSKEVNQYVSNGMRLIHSPKTRDNIVSQLQTGTNPAVALAQTTVNVLNQLDSSSSQSGAAVSPEVVLQGSSPIMEQVMEVGEASGAFQITEPQIKEAAGMAVSLYIKNGMEAGRITMADMQNLYNSSKEAAMEEQNNQPVMGPTGGGANEQG